MPSDNNAGLIELRLRDSAQLFNTLDPFPFRQRDLSAEAERFIVEWAQELPKQQPIGIVIHLPARGDDGALAPDLATAIASWFEARARAESHALRELFRDGRRALLIGFVVLAICLFVSWSLGHYLESPFTRVVQESFVIIGWVVIWRPAEMFLYDWLPIVRRRTLYDRLARAKVTVETDTAPSS